MSDDLIKDALRMMPYGFYALSSKNGDDVNIMVANWVTQVSFTPRLVAVGLAKSARTHGLIRVGRVFTINMFNKEDDEAIKPYTKSTAKNPDKMKTAQFTPAPITGCPVVAGAAAYIECQVKAILDVGGDHDIVIGEPVGAEVYKHGEPVDTLSLLTLGWSYAG